MKNLTKLFYLALIFLVSNTFAQAPQRMSYQAIVRDNLGNLVTNQNVSMRVSILQGSVSGTTSYSETHSTSTNNNGLVTIEIGGGLPITGTFSAINWSTGTYFIKTETDPTGGSNYTIVGTSQLLSVPYALYAENTKQQGKSSIYLMGAITNDQAIAQLAKEFGPNTENIYIRNTTQLTSVDLTSITTLVNLEVKNNTALTSLNVSNLVNVINAIDIQNNLALTSLNFPGITETSASITIVDSSTSTVSFPNLTKVNNDLRVDGVALTSVVFPLLTEARSILIRGLNVTNLSMAALTSCKNGLNCSSTNLSTFIMPNLTSAVITIRDNPSLTIVDLPVLVDALFDAFTISGNVNLTSIQIP